MSISQSTQTDSFKDSDETKRAPDQSHDIELTSHHFTVDDDEFSYPEHPSIRRQNFSNKATDRVTDEEADSEKTKSTTEHRTLLDEEQFNDTVTPESSHSSKQENCKITFLEGVDLLGSESPSPTLDCFILENSDNNQNESDSFGDSNGSINPLDNSKAPNLAKSSLKSNNNGERKLDQDFLSDTNGVNSPNQNAADLSGIDLHILNDPTPLSDPELPARSEFRVTSTPGLPSLLQTHVPQNDTHSFYQIWQNLNGWKESNAR
ncbi:hypothetical protein L596_021344 [Steinernema carpocapsae]|uniref:Uncharacterized protein n=1 Tax=Steinernema carpocapsae TaxID=34508 RepID=A0A4V5ZZV2_STECR|nr:hypothetical protein L596_021344 [Steinernema carpocapsae]